MGRVDASKPKIDTSYQKKHAVDGKSGPAHDLHYRRDAVKKGAEGALRAMGPGVQQARPRKGERKSWQRKQKERLTLPPARSN